MSHWKQKMDKLKVNLQKLRVEKEDLEEKFNAIQMRVDQYNKKINSLTEESNAKIGSS